MKNNILTIGLPLSDNIFFLHKKGAINIYTGSALLSSYEEVRHFGKYMGGIYKNSGRASIKGSDIFDSKKKRPGLNYIEWSVDFDVNTREPKAITVSLNKYRGNDDFVPREPIFIECNGGDEKYDLFVLAGGDPAVMGEYKKLKEDFPKILEKGEVQDFLKTHGFLK